MDIYGKTPEYKKIGESIYSLLQKSSTSFQDKPALSYFHKEITFRELMERIDLVAGALTRIGVSKGDVVIVSLPSIPQAVELFYAVNKIGAIYCGMDCRSTSGEIDEIINQVKPKACFVADFHLDQFRHIDDVPVICISFMKTIGPVAAFASFFVGIFTGRFSTIAKKKNFYSYKSFLSYKEKTEIPPIKVEGDDICAYFYTSGTTYGRKCVVLTNENINASITQYAYSQPGIDETDRFCSIMPLFTCYGITLGTHLPLVLGKQIRLIPLFNGKNMKKLLILEKPGYITTVPSHWEHFIKDDFKNVDLSFFKGAIIGGDKASRDCEDKINAILKKCKSPGKVMRGYGLTEAGTAVTVQLPETPKGSVGHRMCWSEIGIFRPGTDIEAPEGENGEICVCGPNVCQGYLDDEEATESLLKKHSDGKVWLHSGDVGYLDKDGFLYFCERIKRIFVRYDGTKISPYAIEQQLYNCPVVSGCLVCGIDDLKYDHGKTPCALIVLKKGVDPIEAKAVIDKFIHTKIAYHLRPAKVYIVDALPVTKSGKFDYFRATEAVDKIK